MTTKFFIPLERAAAGGYEHTMRTLCKTARGGLMRVVLVILLLGQVQLFAQVDSCYFKWAKDVRRFNSGTFTGEFQIQIDNKECDSVSAIDIVCCGVRFKNEHDDFRVYYHSKVGISTFGVPHKFNPDQNSSYWYEMSPSEFIPIDMVKFYFISAIYYKNFLFRESVALGIDSNHMVKPVPRKDGDLAIRNSQYRKNERILKEVAKSIWKFNELVQNHGLKYVREKGIHPLYYSKYRWL